MIQMPEDDEMRSETGSKTAIQPSENQEPALADGIVEQADGIPIGEVMEFLVFAGDVVEAVLDFFPETQSLSIRQLYDAVMRAHERYESVGVMELAQVAHEMLSEIKKTEQ